MITLLLMAYDEWRFWLRSQLALCAIALFIILLLSIGAVNIINVIDNEHQRLHDQETAEETFLSQPDRHPHRMVHYGHYVFRTPSPLAVIDPGLDAVTGQSIFLEGHRQNTATFDESSASADFGALSWLSPAVIYQWFAPLLLVVLGYGSVVRERESSTLATLLLQNINGRQILMGKVLALITMSCLLLLPLLLTAMLFEGLTVAITLTVSYLLYMTIWSVLTVCVSAVIKKRATILATMSLFWIGICLVIPSIIVDVEAQFSNHKGKIESDLMLFSELRKLGDGHNSNDPAFLEIRSQLLAQYQVDNVEDLPVNLRGVVAKYSEEKLTQVLNRYAQQRMTLEKQQAQRLENYGWFSPALAIASVSRAISATDLYHYHQFLIEAEDLRYDFVQELNEAHSTQLSYMNDVNRNNSKVAEKKSRISAENWNILEDFRFKPIDLGMRINNASLSLSILVAWFIVLTMIIFVIGRSVKP